jgi:hypothetical protein
VGWADSDQQLLPIPLRTDYVDDPFAPHKTNGNTARIGTAVGFVYGEPTSVLAIGFTAALGHRFGRLTLEGEYTRLSFQSNGQYMTSIGPVQGDIGIGSGDRLAALARLDVIRLGSNVVGANSMLAVYVEGGAALAWNHWDLPGAADPARLVPDATQRIEGQVGFGVMLDHRLQEPIGFPHRVGWFLGWRLAMTPHQPMAAAICRGVSCSVATPMDDGSTVVDRSMLFQSSLMFTF